MRSKLGSAGIYLVADVLVRFNRLIKLDLILNCRSQNGSEGGRGVKSGKVGQCCFDFALFSFSTDQRGLMWIHIWIYQGKHLKGQRAGFTDNNKSWLTPKESGKMKPKVEQDSGSEEELSGTTSRSEDELELQSASDGSSESEGTSKSDSEKGQHVGDKQELFSSSEEENVESDDEDDSNNIDNELECIFPIGANVKFVEYKESGEYIRRLHSKGFRIVHAELNTDQLLQLTATEVISFSSNEDSQPAKKLKKS